MPQSEVLIIGAGIAGMVCAYECLQQGKQVRMIDRHPRHLLGGLARWSFGGMAIVNTPLQKRMRIEDNVEIAWQDWQNFAEYEVGDKWPRVWGQYYVEHSRRDIYEYLTNKSLRFLPAVNWVERGMYGRGNSVPRYHVLWGTGQGLVDCFEELLKPYENKGLLRLDCEMRCEGLVQEQGRIVGCVAHGENDEKRIAYHAEQTVVATGGINGNIEKLRQHWKQCPDEVLNGSHPYADGHLHDVIGELGGAVTHLDKMWNYAAGIPDPDADFAGKGLSLIPSKSALWLDHTGKRLGPEPLVTGFDTNELCRRVSELEQPYTWHVLNWHIAAKEMAISGSRHNPSIRDRKILGFLKELLFGNQRLIKQLESESDHFLVADKLEELTVKMNRLNGNQAVKTETLRKEVAAYDAMIARGPKLWNDDQLRRIEHARAWRSDKLRTCAPAPLLKASHGPLIAIKLRLITRKSLGGIQTDLSSRVLDVQGSPMPGLYAIGEAAGFGGGGASGKRSLEGTFLSGCIMTAQAAAAGIKQA